MAVELIKNGVLFVNNKDIIECSDGNSAVTAGLGMSEPKEYYRNNTMAYKILNEHNTSNDEAKLKLKFDCLASHDITYVGIIQSARASGLEKFPVPYVLTNCHNSLCAVGGTINEDDHVFGLSAAKKYGGIFVPAHLSVIHTYMREMMSGCGKMILGSDSHTRYGALGCMAIGEGGPELVKQLLSRTYDVDAPEVIAVHLSGKIKNGIGPQDVALKIIGEVFKNGFVKNKILEFIGDGVKDLPIEFRNGIDVMTTETSCLSSIWTTDGEVKKYYQTHHRADAYKEIKPGEIAYYDGAIKIDLSKIECMIAMPFHPSNVYTIKEVNENTADIINAVEVAARSQLDTPNIEYTLKNKIKGNRFKADQAVVAGCAGGTFDNICAVYDIIKNKTIGSSAEEFALSIYPGSQPINIALAKNGISAELLNSGAVMRSAFCGPCFGACDVPSNSGFSIRHSTRNFPNREGSSPTNGQIASVALMDARSIAATAVNDGYLTPATDVDVDYGEYEYNFDKKVYENRVYSGYGKPIDTELKFGPNIADFPAMDSLNENLMLKICSVITDEVTTTDELIPSGETSSYRSNPLKLAGFALSRKDPKYVERAKSIKDISDEKIIAELLKKINGIENCEAVGLNSVSFGSVIFANKPGDGSAREQAASCQKILGGMANIAREYATKRYRSNLINWGMIPFIYQSDDLPFELESFIFIPEIKSAIENKNPSVKAYIINSDNAVKEIRLNIPEFTDDERDIILSGCLINYYRQSKN